MSWPLVILQELNNKKVVFEVKKAAKVAQQKANEAQKVADEAFENLGISRNAAETIKTRIKRTNQPEEIFLKYIENL